MENALPKIIGGVSLALADAQAYAKELIMLFRRFASETPAWTKAANGFGVIAIGTVGTAGLLLLGSLIILRIRSRRKAQALQEELAKQLARAEAAESANQAKAKLLAKMSRQIRTQLNSIVGFTDLALKTDLHPELREYMDTVRMSAYWLMNVADNVVEFSQIQAGKLKLESRPFSIADCIASVMKIVGQDASAKKLSTTCKIDPRLPHAVCGDPTRFRHIIFNLVDNAVRFTTTGGVIVSATVEAESVDDVLVGIAVIDTGMGIPPERHPLIFEPFSHCNTEADDEYHGSGMGLAISRRLVDLMSGTMRFQSHLGAGSRFEFTARFRKYSTSSVESLVPAVAACGAAQEFSILVAEDNTINRRLIAKILESSGSRVRMVTNGAEAVQEAETDSFDLILMDMEMPDLDGLEATRAIRSAEPAGSHVPIYALTAHSFAVDRDRCFEAGMDGFFTKPVSADEILQLISQLRKSRPPRKAAASAFELPVARTEQESKRPVPETPAEVVQTGSPESSVVARDVDRAMSDAFDGESEAALHAFLTHPLDLPTDPPASVESGEAEPQVEVESASDLIDLGEAVGLSEPCPLLHEEFAPEREAVNKLDSPLPKIDLAGTLFGEAFIEDSRQEVAEPVAVLPSGKELESPDEPALVAVTADVREYFSTEPERNGHEMVKPPSALVDLAFPRPTYQITWNSPSPAKENSGATPAGPSPFEQARQALYRSRFDVRIVHNNGDPSDRDLI